MRDVEVWDTLFPESPCYEAARTAHLETTGTQCTYPLNTTCTVHEYKSYAVHVPVHSSNGGREKEREKERWRKGGREGESWEGTVYK